MRLESEIARLEDARQTEGLLEIATDHVRVAGGVAVYAGPESWCNLVSGVGLDAPVTDADLDVIDRFYAGRGVDVRFEVSPYADPTLLRRLHARGYVADRFENVLAREVVGPIAVDGPPGIAIRPVGPGEERVCVEVASSGFRDGPISAADLEVGLRMVGHPLVVGVIAWAGQEPVGAGYVEVRGPVAGLFGASVLPGWRRRGIQAAMVRARLAITRARGAELATVGSIPGEPTERNVARLGFRVICTKLHLVRPAT